MFKMGTNVNVNLTQHKEVFISGIQKSQFIRTMSIIFIRRLLFKEEQELLNKCPGYF